MKLGFRADSYLLEIFEVSHVMDELGGIVSSSRIRAGLIDQTGRHWLTQEQRKMTYHFHRGLDEELKTIRNSLRRPRRLA